MNRGDNMCKEGDLDFVGTTSLRCRNGTWIPESCMTMDGPSFKEGEIVKLGSEILQCQKVAPQQLKLARYLGTTPYPITEGTWPCPLCVYSGK